MILPLADLSLQRLLQNNFLAINSKRTIKEMVPITTRKIVSHSVTAFFECQEDSYSVLYSN